MKKKFTYLDDKSDTPKYTIPSSLKRKISDFKKARPSKKK